MKKYLTAGLTILAIPAFSQQLHFRNDGFYLFDNGKDTVYMAQPNNATVNSLQKKIAPAAAANGAVLDGSSSFEVLAFFSDNAATEIKETTWDEGVQKRVVSEINDQKAGKNKPNYTISTVLNKDNTFRISISNKGKTFKTITGTLYEDHIVATVVYSVFPHQAAAKPQTYRFYKFNQSPPARNKLVYVYKDPYKK